MVSKDGSDRRFRVKELSKYKIKSDIVFSPLNIYPKYAGLSFCEIRSFFYISPFFTNKDRLWPLCICKNKISKANGTKKYKKWKYFELESL